MRESLDAHNEAARAGSAVATAVLDLDANDPAMRDHVGTSYMVDWLKANHIDPKLCYRVEVLANGDGVLRVHSFDSLWQTEPWPTAATPDMDERDIWGLDPVLVPMVAPVPAELRAEITRRDTERPIA